MNYWKKPSNYMGAHWDGWLVFLGRTRDSDTLTNSNFETALAGLKALDSVEVPGEDCNSIQVVSENHWACGWVEWIAIHPCNTAAVAIAEALQARIDRYPVLDEDDLSRREDEEAQTVWRDCYSDRERVEYIRAHRSQFEFRSLADVLYCVRGKHFCGYASELINR